MTVAELIEVLKKLPQDYEVCNNEDPSLVYSEELINNAVEHDRNVVWL